MQIKRKYSILYPDFPDVEYKKLSETTCHDLALDFLCEKITTNRKESKLIMETISHMTSDPRVAEYRQQVFCDILKFPMLRKQMIELFDKFEFIRDFGVLHRSNDERMEITNLLSRMDELNDYIICVESMQNCLTENAVESDGLKGFKKYVDGLYQDACFAQMKADIDNLKISTSEIKSVTVGINVNERFEATGLGLISINNKPFKKSGIVSNFAEAIGAKQKIQDSTEWNGDMHYHSVDGGISIENLVTGVAKMRASDNIIGQATFIKDAERRATMANVPDGDGLGNSTFYLSSIVTKLLDVLVKKLRDVLNKYADIAVVNISELIPEFIYYIRFAEFVEKNMNSGYQFVRANVSEDESLMKAEEFYNLKLAVSGMEMENIVTNNLGFDNEHTVYILTGANRGGKTTITQAVGIMYVLAQGGIFVPASSFNYKPVDCIYTHFPADEDKTLDLGRLGEECIRFKESYTACTKDSLCLLNESFSTTSFEEGYYIAKDSVRALLKKSVRTIYNTHMHKLGSDIDELNEENSEAKASSLVMQSDGKERSFKVEIAPPKGKSYARDIAEKYGVTYEMLTTNI